MAKIALSSKYLCSSCKLTIRIPIQTYCGHRYCNFCFEKKLRQLSPYLQSPCLFNRENNPLCEACSEEESGSVSMLSREEMFYDKGILRELNDIIISCQNAGCPWNGSYSEYDQEHADGCCFGRIKCTNTGCDVHVRRGDLVDHLENACDVRIVQCSNCRYELPYRDLQTHTEDCESAPVKCPYCKKKDIPRARVEVDQYDDHGEQHVTEHLDLLLKAVITLTSAANETKHQSRQNEALKEEITKHQNCLDELTSTSDHIKAEITKIKATMESERKNILTKSIMSDLEENEKLVKSLSTRSKVIETKLSTCEAIVGALNNQLERNVEAVKALETQRRRDREMMAELERQIKAQEKTISAKDKTLSENNLRIQSLEQASHDGFSVWKITDFNKKRSEAISGKTRSFYSPCFYSSRHGCKMCARIYLNGDGMGKGNHVSLFFVIMKGPFDALLRWPFRQKVTLMWVDQNNREHIVDAFRPDPTSSSFKRPTTDMNIASGCPLFMPLSMLDSPLHAFVKDDTAFLKIIVDTSDIL